MLGHLRFHRNQLVEVRPVNNWVCWALARGGVGTKPHVAAPRGSRRLEEWLPPKNRAMNEWGITWAF